ncbi:MAG: 23S rRNA (adenine(2503)-C(2))-methyltransferase RlmN, partial [Bacteroidaceae bacterium]|nr:23S rRNA (adenine(2503)-C(2))-methyltransferase RlmN [Bacteroidaceae bacterium]
MGQGEPLDNYDNVAKAIEILTSEDGFAMSPKRITLSTCGILPALKKIVRESRCNIAISLHSPYHEERMEIMPIEKAYEVSEVMKYLKTCEEFRDIRGGRARETSHQRRLSFEYVLLKDKNDSQKHASDIAAMLKGLDCRVNVIPFHTYKGGEFKSPAHADAEAFCELLCRRGLNATLRRSRGQDISAACGMLAAKRKSEEAAKENAD